MPYMSQDTHPEPNLAPCGNCGEPWEAHEECTERHGVEDVEFLPCGIRVCADGREFASETDEDRAAARAAAKGL